MGRLCLAVFSGLFLSLLVSSLETPEKPDTRRILTRHDQYRTLAQASDMMKLSWSTKLEEVAAAAVQACPQSVAEIRALPGVRGRGVNLGAAPYPPRMIDGYPEDIQTSIIDEWGGERANFYADSGCPSEPCNAWWQIVWSKASRIGCSIKVCRNQSIMACIYNSPSNTKADIPYKTGTPCSACPVGYTHCKAGMCHPEKEQLEGEDEEDLGIGGVEEEEPVVSVTGKDPSLLIVTGVARDDDPVQPKLENPDDGDGASQLNLFISTLGLILLQISLAP